MSIYFGFIGFFLFIFKGIVYSGSPKANPEFKLALKKILRKNESEGVNFTALREIKSLQEIDHPNIIKVCTFFFHIFTKLLSRHFQKLLEVFVYKKSVYLVFPLMEFDLEAVIKDPKIPFKPAEIKCYMKMILEGVAHLHSRWIIHRVQQNWNFVFRKINFACLVLGFETK